MFNAVYSAASPFRFDNGSIQFPAFAELMDANEIETTDRGLMIEKLAEAEGLRAEWVRAEMKKAK